MFERLSRSWKLVKASAHVLRQDPELLVFPLVSAGALLLVLAAFAVPVIGLGTLDGLAAGNEDAISAAMYAVAFLFYFVQYFVIFFFNAALVGAVMIRLDGGNPTLADGLRIASSKVVVILCYAFIAATVGMILRILQERLQIVGRIVVALVGAAWSIATYLVVPVLVDRDVGPLQAVKESALLLKKTWGENLIGQAGIGLAFGLIFFGAIVVSVVVLVMAAATESVFVIGAAVLLILLALTLIALVQAALTGIYAAALYRYASNGEASAGFDAGSLELAFAPK